MAMKNTVSIDDFLTKKNPPFYRAFHRLPSSISGFPFPLLQRRLICSQKTKDEDCGPSTPQMHQFDVGWRIINHPWNFIAINSWYKHGFQPFSVMDSLRLFHPHGEDVVVASGSAGSFTMGWSDTMGWIKTCSWMNMDDPGWRKGHLIFVKAGALHFDIWVYNSYCIDIDLGYMEE